MSRSLAARASLLAVLLVGVAPSPTLAHAEVVASEPPANASLVEAPGSVSITFSEPIDPELSFVDLIDQQQRAVEVVGEVVVSGAGRIVEVTLPALEPGVYTVTYQVVSTVDGHATTGSFAFVIDPTGAAPPPTDSLRSSSPSVDPITVAARWLALAMLLVGLGSLVLWWHAGRPLLNARFPDVEAGPPWRLVAAAGALAAAGVAGYLALSARPIRVALGADAGTGIPLDVAGPFGWTAFAIAMRVAFACAVIAAGLAMVGAVRRPNPGTRLAGLTGLVLAAALAAMSMAGHAAAAGGPAFAAIDWLHLLAVAAWLGGLPAAFVLASRAAKGRGWVFGGLLRRHGRLALFAAPVVALTGVANSPLVLGGARDLVASDYGNLLLAKAGLLSVAVGIGAVNHLALRGRGRAAVGTLVAAELAVAVLAVSAAATMVTIQPASARQPQVTATPVNPAHFFGTVGPSRVHASVSLPAPGSQAYLVTVTDARTGAPRTDLQKVFLELAPPPETGLPVGRVELEADPRGDGLYAANGAYTPVVGEWGLAVILRRAGERDEAIGFELPVTQPEPPGVGPPPDTGIGVPAPIAATWALLPAGPTGWLPAFLALAAVALLGRARPWRGRGIARGFAVGVLIVATAAAGSRSLVAAANAPGEADLARQPAPDSAPDVVRGEAIYRANCASCHGLALDGQGPVRTLPEAGALDRIEAASDAELSYRISHGSAGTPMPAFAGLLTADERSDLIAYLRQATDD